MEHFHRQGRFVDMLAGVNLTPKGLCRYYKKSSDPNSGPNGECTKACPESFRLFIANSTDPESTVFYDYQRIRNEEIACTIKGRKTGKFVNYALTVSLRKTLYPIIYRSYNILWDVSLS